MSADEMMVFQAFACGEGGPRHLLVSAVDEGDLRVIGKIVGEGLPLPPRKAKVVRTDDETSPLRVIGDSPCQVLLDGCQSCASAYNHTLLRQIQFSRTVYTSSIQQARRFFNPEISLEY